MALCCEVPSDGRFLLKMTKQDGKWAVAVSREMG